MEGGDFEFVIYRLALLFVFFFCNASKSEIFSIDMETGDLRQWKNKCSCSSEDKKGVLVTDKLAKSGKYSVLYVQSGFRTETATERLPIDEDLVITWSLYLPGNFPLDDSGTVSQLIEYQKGCFHGGNFHFRVENGRWAVRVRNLGGKYDRLMKNIVLNEWTNFTVLARFSREHGYFKLKVEDSAGAVYLDVINDGETLVECSKGAYFKSGLYAGIDIGVEMYMDDFLVNLSDSPKWVE